MLRRHPVLPNYLFPAPYFSVTARASRPVHDHLVSNQLGKILVRGHHECPVTLLCRLACKGPDHIVSFETRNLDDRYTVSLQ